MGRLFAETCLDRGATVAVLDIDKDGLDQTVAELGSRGDIRGWVCDMADLDAIYKSAEEVIADLGGIDVLINNAGIVSAGPITEVSEDKHTLTFMVNALGVARMSRAVLPSMIARGRGHIVNIASAAGLTGVALGATYSSSKWAVVGFSESLLYEMAHLGHPIKVTCVCPGYVDTGMFDGVKPPLLMPLLRPTTVVRHTMKAIEDDARMVTLPYMVSKVPLLRAVLPDRIQDFLANKLGVNRSMETWKGHGR